jgi:hypothetical protein
MGYYYFFHENGQQNKKPLPFNFGLSWTKNFQKFSEDEKISAFRKVINLNDDWPTGKIYAEGDDDTRMFIFDPKTESVTEIWNNLE